MVNQEGVDYYNRLIDYMVKKGNFPRTLAYLRQYYKGSLHQCPDLLLVN
jgi:hypothetical protein